jgi:hypothetical protein
MRASLPYLWGGLVGLAIAYLHYSTYRNPNRNSLTRFISSWAEEWWQPADSALVIMCVVSGLLGVVGLVVFLIKLTGPS